MNLLETLMVITLAVGGVVATLNMAQEAEQEVDNYLLEQKVHIGTIKKATGVYVDE